MPLAVSREFLLIKGGKKVESKPTKCLRYGHNFQDRNQRNGPQRSPHCADHLAKGHVLPIHCGAKGWQSEGWDSSRNVASDPEGLSPVSAENVGQEGAKDHSQGIAGEAQVLPEDAVAPRDVLDELWGIYKGYILDLSEKCALSQRHFHGNHSKVKTRTRLIGFNWLGNNPLSVSICVFMASYRHEEQEDERGDAQQGVPNPYGVQVREEVLPGGQQVIGRTFIGDRFH